MKLFRLSTRTAAECGAPGVALRSVRKLETPHAAVETELEPGSLVSPPVTLYYAKASSFHRPRTARYLQCVIPRQSFQIA